MLEKLDLTRKMDKEEYKAKMDRWRPAWASCREGAKSWVSR